MRGRLTGIKRIARWKKRDPPSGSFNETDDVQVLLRYSPAKPEIRLVELQDQSDLDSVPTFGMHCSHRTGLRCISLLAIQQTTCATEWNPNRLGC